MDFNLTKIDYDNLTIVKNLFQLYLHDVSTALSLNTDTSGLFQFDYSLSEWLENGNFGYLIYSNNNLAGFALVDRNFKVLESQDNALSLSRVFVLNAYKNRHIATNVLSQIFKLHPANWEVRSVPNSTRAQEFLQSFFDEYDYNTTTYQLNDNSLAFVFSNA